MADVPASILTALEVIYCNHSVQQWSRARTLALFCSCASNTHSGGDTQNPNYCYWICLNSMHSEMVGAIKHFYCTALILAHCSCTLVLLPHSHAALLLLALGDGETEILLPVIFSIIVWFLIYLLNWNPHSFLYTAMASNMWVGNRLRVSLQCESSESWEFWELRVHQGHLSGSQ